MSAIEDSFSSEKLGPYTKPIRVKIIAHDEKIVTYTSGTEEKKCLIVVFCDGVAYARGLCYSPKDFAKLQLGNSVVLRDVIRKLEEGRRTIVLTRTTKVFLTSPLTVGDALAEEGRGFLHLPDADYVNLKTALTSPLKKRVSLKGKIVQEDDEVVKPIRGVDTARKTIVIEDESGRAKCTLWRDAINKKAHVGDFVTITNVVTHIYNNETTLTTTGRSKCEKADVPLVDETLTITGVCVDGTSASLLTEEDDVYEVPAELLVTALPPGQNPELLTLNGPVEIKVQRKGAEVVSLDICD